MTKSKHEILSEGVAKVQTLAERIKYQPGQMLPSEVDAQFAAIQTTVKDGYGEPPATWNELTELAGYLIRESRREPRIQGAFDYYTRAIQESAKRVVDGEHTKRVESELIAAGRAIRRATFDRLSLAEQGTLLRSGKVVFD